MSPLSSSAATPRPARRRRRIGRRRLLVLGALVVVLALVGAACKQLDPDNRAAAVPGVTNGKLPLSYLASNGKGCVVYDEALASLKAMVAAAALDNIDLRAIGCYRDYAGQVATRDEWCGKGACQMAAVPGTSNHGWGKAIDFADKAGELTFDSEAYRWLKAWAGIYGWMHPKSMEPDGPIPEPWHWEWVGDGGKMFAGEYFGLGNTPLLVPRGMPFGYVDTVTPVPGGVQVGGWAIDPDQVSSIPVHVYVDQAGTALMANQKRPDVNAAFPLYEKADHGFSAFIPASPGAHRVCIYALNVAGTGSNRELTCVMVTVPNPGVAASVAPAAPAPAPAAPAPSTTTTSVPSPTTTTTTPPTTVAEAQGTGTPAR